jgi:hypothetical protein
MSTVKVGASTTNETLLARMQEQQAQPAAAVGKTYGMMQEEAKKNPESIYSCKDLPKRLTGVTFDEDDKKFYAVIMQGGVEIYRGEYFASKAEVSSNAWYKVK